MAHVLSGGGGDHGGGVNHGSDGAVDGARGSELCRPLRRQRWDAGGRIVVYRITARPQFRVKLAACGGRAAAAARSVAPEIVFGRGRILSGAAPQSPCGRARASASLRQRSPRRPPDEYPGAELTCRFTSRPCAYFGLERAPGRVGRAARALAAVLWWWCVALLRLVALCAPPPGPSGVGAPPLPSVRAAEDAPSAAACASAPSNTTEPTPPPPPPAAPDTPAHTEWWWAGACVGAAVLLCAAGALACPHLRRRNATAAPAALAAPAAVNPMLSVQVPGCAGMERLGAPGGPRLRHDHRHHHSTLEWEKQQTLQAMVGRLQEMVEQETRARSAAAAERLGLPPSIQLPDGEYGQDAHLQLRVPYQQAELTRSSFQPPPNKCVSDVPEWAGAAEAPAARRGGKKDGLLQKATRWWVRMGTRGAPALLPGSAAPTPAVVMVPRRAAPAAPPDA
ncbi:translation initiation factor IF-2 [Manduca sexta]|uniref:translation initiation factor IF-2 n=1 Tax=Manduca sexta TaxID=7130 RepID=UPI00189021FA|nr:translation initiation factor IF-2 [Manduca sexta]